MSLKVFTIGQPEKDNLTKNLSILALELSSGDNSSKESKTINGLDTIDNSMESCKSNDVYPNS
jgi:hypothetical protein